MLVSPVVGGSVCHRGASGAVAPCRCPRGMSWAGSSPGAAAGHSKAPPASPCALPSVASSCKASPAAWKSTHRRHLHPPSWQVQAGCPRGTGHPTASKTLKQNKNRKREFTDPEQGARLQQGRRMCCSFGGISHHSSFSFLGRNESVAQPCRAPAEQDGAEGEARHKGQTGTWPR